jgi:ADP-ribosylglycohydrolase
VERTSPKQRDRRQDLTRLDRVRGCLLGGAVGDALGAPVEFLSLSEIRARFGSAGITESAPAYGRVGAITDDTQMTLFSAEGLLRAVSRWNELGICHPPSVVYNAYLRWLRTQGVTGPEPVGFADAPGWLIGIKTLHARRAPGNTCLSALKSGEMGTTEKPINSSKGCGGVMRAAPCGLIDHGDAFRLGTDVAAITHGHPTGYLTAGCLALIVHDLLREIPLITSIQNAAVRVSAERDHDETTRALDRAMELSRAGDPSAERVESLGGGWVAEEALAIALYCALVAGDDFESGVRLAVNHGGDSDSTGAIAGNLLGAMLGDRVIPRHWVDQLELREEITQLADDIVAGYRKGDEWWRRYPGC